MYEGLVSLVPPEYSALGPGLAEKWSLLEDKTTWQFELRQGVLFHDGTELTAEDAVFSVRRYKSLSAQARLTTLASIEAAGRYTFLVRTMKPDLSLPYSLINGWIMSKTAPQYLPTFELNKQITMLAEEIGFDYVFSMAKWTGYGGETQYWDSTIESFTLMAALATATTKLRLRCEGCRRGRTIYGAHMLGYLLAAG